MHPSFFLSQKGLHFVPLCGMMEKMLAERGGVLRPKRDMTNTNKSPYHGVPIIAVILCVPSVLLTLIFYGVLMEFQGRYGAELNSASARVVGCGLGVIFHLSCWLMGSFRDSARVVKNRLKEFFSDLSVSFSLAVKWYWEDVKTNGAAYWIFFAIIVANLVVTIVSLADAIALLAPLL